MWGESDQCGSLPVVLSGLIAGSDRAVGLRSSHFGEEILVESCNDGRTCRLIVLKFLKCSNLSNKISAFLRNLW